MNRPRKRVLCQLARLMLAAVFVYAGTAKLIDITALAVGLSDFGQVCDSLVIPTAWAFAFAELSKGLALAIHPRGSFFAALALPVLFIGVLSYGVRMGLDIDRGCFGPGYYVSLKIQLLTDLGLVLWWIVVYISHKRCDITPASPRDRQSWVLDY